MTSFRAFRVEKTEDRQFPRSIVERDIADLPPGDLLIDVAWKDRQNNASIAMVAGVSVWSLSGPMSVREQTNRGRGDAISSRRT